MPFSRLAAKFAGASALGNVSLFGRSAHADRSTEMKPASFGASENTLTPSTAPALVMLGRDRTSPLVFSPIRSSRSGKDQCGKRTWFARGMVCGLFSLGVLLLVLNGVLFASQTMHTMYTAEADPDTIFSAWGHPGTGTEDLAWYPTDFLRDVVPIPCHSHNDYWRKVPLFSALRAGCIGTEADVWLVEDELYVGHSRAALSANRTFRSLYVDPLMRILERQNPTSGFYNASSETPRGVFDMQPNQTLVLLVDVKTSGDATFHKVLAQVEPLRQRGWLSTFDHGRVRYGPVTVVGSGNTPFDVVVENDTYRYAFFDAPLARLENGVYDMTNSYYASVSMEHGLGTVWFGALQRGQLRHTRYQLLQAHARGLKGRYWNLPAWPISLRNAVWTALAEQGVDLLNVDDIMSAARRDWTRASVSKREGPTNTRPA